jgi:hypothetical protein
MIAMDLADVATDMNIHFISGLHNIDPILMREKTFTSNDMYLGGDVGTQGAQLGLLFSS